MRLPSTPRTNRRHVGLTFTLIALVAVAACSDEVVTPEDPSTDTPVAGANGGELLVGAASGNAWAAFREVRPTPAARTTIVEDVILARLTAIVHPDATVEAVNMALVEHGAGIVSMVPGSLLLSLAIAPVADAAAAEAVASSLTETDAFVFAFPARTRRSPIAASPVTPGHAPPTAGPDRVPIEVPFVPTHQNAIRLPAAWNAAGLAKANGHRVTVLVPDFYHSDTPHPDISAQVFEGGGGAYDPGENHGSHVAGIIGADPDGDGAAGTSPDPSELIEIRSLDVTGLSQVELAHAIAASFPDAGSFVMNTSLGYPNDDPISVDERVERAFHALSWRILTHADEDRYVHGTAAGNEGENADLRGEARYGSEFSISSMWADIRDIVPLDSLTAAEVAGFDAAWNAMLAVNPGASAQPANVLVVGSSDVSGQESSFSNRGSDVRVVGESVVSTCVVQEPDWIENFTCDGDVAAYDGTSMATPQVVGVAAYLWNLDPSLETEEIVATLRAAYDGGEQDGLLDVYAAVLSLDASIDDAPVRASILDVAGGTLESTPNGVFDEIDVETFLTFFASYEEARANGDAGEDYSRYDLSGEGFTGGEYASGMDLTTGGGPLGTATQIIEGSEVTFDEVFVNDLAVLCYYAYSPLYQGDPDRRAELLAECDPADVNVDVQIGGLLHPDEDVPVTVVVTSFDGAPVAGATIQLGSGEATIETRDGVTEADGSFSTTMRIQNSRNEATVVAIATTIEDEQYRGMATEQRRNELLLRSRLSILRAEARFTRRGAGPNSTVFDNRDELYFPDTVPLDSSFAASGSGAYGGVGTSGSAQTQHESLLLGTSDAFQGFRHEASGSAEGSLAASTDTVTYTAEYNARSRLDVDFYVWGEPATFTLTLSQNEMSRIDFYGSGGFGLCVQGSEICEQNGFEIVDESLDPDGTTRFTLSGILQPGGYGLGSTMNARIVFDNQVDDDEPENPDEWPDTGSGTIDGHVTLSFSISH